MIKETLRLRHLCFTGPEKEDAFVNFHPGLNIIYGASDTGKSFILEAIDFMLGSSHSLRDIPERVGYDRVWLGISDSNDNEFTLTRSTEGGDLHLYAGLHHINPKDVEAITLKYKHDAKNDNISSHLLDLIGLSNKKLKKKEDGSTMSFTLPFLRHLCIISETDIQKQGSPITTGQFTQTTAEMSAFKLLITGVDDSAIIKSNANSPATHSREAKLEVIEELILSYETRHQEFSQETFNGADLSDQLQRLDQTINIEQAQLGLTEEGYRDLSTRRNYLRSSIEKSIERKAEISEMLQRFTLLKEHYSSDISRLEGIQEAGSLVSALLPGPCPLCGSNTGSPHPDTICDANLDVVVVAAIAEKSKIERLRRELEETIHKLVLEKESFERLIPKSKDELSILESHIAEVAPSVMEHRSSYQSLIDKRSIVRALFTAWNELNELKARRAAIENTSASSIAETATSREISASVLDSFSQLFESTLKAWHFPNAERTYFDQQKKDFVISGKPRGSRGKGMRAITHAAFTVSLLEFCRREKHPHLGFIVMDSPLLAYREPDVADDGIANTSLNENFFDYLSKWTDRQVIIIENVDPPNRFTQKSYSTHFTGNTDIGRAGFFPLP